MTNKLYSIALLFIVSILISCSGSDSNDYVDKSLITPESEKKAAQQTTANNTTLPNSPVIPGVNNVNPAVPVSAVNLSQSNNLQVVPTAATTGNLNPAHGQPGHRCDISVGAPLDSKPAPVATTTAAATPASTPVPAAASPVTITQQPVKTVTAPGMNPAHGEPGHRCDIAVGAPLNSKPPAPTTVNAQPSPATAITATPAAAQKVAPGMNPAHGEPGHRCDIAVGAPLNSKPVAPATVATQAPPPLLTPVKPDSTKN